MLRKAVMALSSDSSGCSSPGGPDRYTTRTDVEGIAVTCSTRAVIQPNRAVTAGGKRLLSLSEGWLLDRGFM
jgi:hypothetical protein